MLHSHHSHHGHSTTISVGRILQMLREIPWGETCRSALPLHVLREADWGLREEPLGGPAGSKAPGAACVCPAPGPWPAAPNSSSGPQRICGSVMAVAALLNLLVCLRSLLFYGQ